MWRIEMKNLIPWGPPTNDYPAPWNAPTFGDYLLERSPLDPKRRAWNGNDHTKEEFRAHYGSNEHWKVVGYVWRHVWHLGLLGVMPHGPP